MFKIATVLCLCLVAASATPISIDLVSQQRIIDDLTALAQAAFNNLLSTVIANVDLSSFMEIAQLFGLGKRDLTEQQKIIDDLTALAQAAFNNLLSTVIANVDLSSFMQIAQLFGLGK